MQLVVVKRSGVVEPFTRDKVINGVRKACKGRPVSEDQLARLAQLVEDSLRALGQPEIPADEVGVAILGPLRELDQVAYLRFASVYRQFRSIDDFEAEIALLRVEQEPTGIEPLIPDRVADNKISNFIPHRRTPVRDRSSSPSEPP
jgi:transcriptional repressor NrdR